MNLINLTNEKEIMLTFAHFPAICAKYSPECLHLGIFFCKFVQILDRDHETPQP